MWLEHSYIVTNRKVHIAEKEKKSFQKKKVIWVQVGYLNALGAI